MQNSTFAQRMNLQPGDVIITPKSYLNIIEHYLTYWGKNADGVDFYFENNYKTGVRWITEDLFVFENPSFLRIRKFFGDFSQRNAAIERGIKLLGAKYDVKTFNCESYANYIQYGNAHSTQVKSANSFLVGAGILTGIALLLSASNKR